MSQRLAKIFIRNVRERMDELGINQTELAERLDRDKSHVSSMLSGRRHPGLQSLEAFASALRLEPSDLLSEKKLAKSA